MPMLQSQSGTPVARRAVFAIALAVSLVLMVTYAREAEDGALHSLQQAVMGATGQAGGVTAGLGAAADGAGSALADANASDSTLSALREQNQELRQLLASADEYRQEAERLQALLNMQKSSGVSGPVGRIIGRSANAWDQSVTIDVGTADGVQAGMTVMGATGVIGQVAHAQDNVSTVRLITDPNSGAAAIVQSSRADCIVRGSLGGLLYLEDIDEDKIPEVGDVVLTSGLGGSYERGLMIGTVVSVNKTTSNSTGSIVVTPNGNVSMLEEVIVVFSAPDVAAQEKAAAEAEAARAAEEAAAQAEAQAAAEQEYLEEFGAYDEGLEG